MLFGPRGLNDKSLILGYQSNDVKEIVATIEPDLLTSKIKGGVSSTLAQSKNSRVVMLSEPPNDNDNETHLNSSLIKSRTGNDSITRRALYRNAETFKPTFNVFLLCNDIPTLERVEPAMILRLNFF